MRLSSLGSGLTLAAALLFSSTVFAQHHEASAPSSPPPSPAPIAAPSPAPAPSPSPAPAPAPSAPASVNVSHSDVSAPVSARASETHIESGASAGSHTSGSAFTQPSSVTAPTSSAERVNPADKISGDDRVKPAPRIGETPPDKEHVVKPEEPDLRRRICVGNDCKEPVLKANPPVSDLRHPICPGGVCRCPPGETPGKGGCVAAPVASPADQNQYQDQCVPGQWWNGTNCTSPAIGCANLTSRAQSLLSELRSLAVQVRDVCGNDPISAECNDATMRRREAEQRYRMLQNEALPECRAQLPEPPI